MCSEMCSFGCALGKPKLLPVTVKALSGKSGLEYCHNCQKACPDPHTELLSFV